MNIIFFTLNVLILLTQHSQASQTIFRDTPECQLTLLVQAQKTTFWTEFFQNRDLKKIILSAQPYLPQQVDTYRTQKSTSKFKALPSLLTRGNLNEAKYIQSYQPNQPDFPSFQHKVNRITSTSVSITDGSAEGWIHYHEAKAVDDPIVVQPPMHHDDLFDASRNYIKKGNTLLGKTYTFVSRNRKYFFTGELLGYDSNNNPAILLENGLELVLKRKYLDMDSTRSGKSVPELHFFGAVGRSDSFYESKFVRLRFKNSTPDLLALINGFTKSGNILATVFEKQEPLYTLELNPLELDAYQKAGDHIREKNYSKRYFLWKPFRKKFSEKSILLIR